MTTPCLRLFNAELTKALRRCCDRRSRRTVDMIQSPAAIRKQQTTRVPSTTSETTFGSAAVRYLTTPDLGLDASTAQKVATRHSTIPAGIMILPPACQFLSAIGHPRITGRSFWLHGFGSSKRVPRRACLRREIAPIGGT